MNFKKALLTTLTTIMVGGVVLSANQNTSQFEPQASSDTNKRVYVYLQGSWDNGNNMYIHYFGGTGATDYNAAPQMIRVIDSFTGSLGLFYYDVPANMTSFLVKDRANGNGFKESNQSVDILMGSVFATSPTNYYAVAISAWLGSDGTKRNATLVNNLTLDDAQVAALLAKISTCSDSTANGFNAYPQINDLFFTTNTFDESTAVADAFGPATIISDKKNKLSENYSRGFAD